MIPPAQHPSKPHSQMRTFAAALLALAASVQALTVSQCTDAGSAATVTYDTSKACYKGTVSFG